MRALLPAVLVSVVHEEHVVGESRPKPSWSAGGSLPGLGFFVTVMFIMIPPDDYRSFRCAMLARMPSQQAWKVAASSFVSGSSDLLHAASADDAGHACEQARTRLFAAELGAGGHDGLFVVQDEMRHARGRGRDTIFGTELAGGWPSRRRWIPSAARRGQSGSARPSRPDIERHAAKLTRDQGANC